EVGAGHVAAVTLHLRGDQLRGPPTVEALRPLRREALQRRGEIALHEALTRTQRPVAVEEHRATRRETPEQALVLGEVRGQEAVDLEAVARERDRRRRHPRERPGAVPGERERDARRTARHRRGGRADEALLGVDAAV